jgi:hypothetical protein
MTPYYAFLLGTGFGLISAIALLWLSPKLQNKPVEPVLQTKRERAYAELVKQILFVWLEVFPKTWAWTGPETAVDLFKAEISTLRYELLKARIAADPQETEPTVTKTKANL